MDKNDLLLADERFRYLKKGNLTLPLCYGDVCIPVDHDDDYSIIAYTLMCREYQEQVLYKMVVEEGEEGKYLIENNLLLPCTDATFSLKINSLEGRDLIKGKVESTASQKLYGDNHYFHVTSYYARQFEALRLYTCGTRDDFILSICGHAG
jgi:hypothetical protein